MTETVDYRDALARINNHRIENGEPLLETLPDLDTHCEECGTAYTEKDLNGGRCLTCGTMIAAPPKVVQRTYVVSFAPSYDEGGVGGFEWRRTWTEVHELMRDPEFLTPGTDYRIITLDLPLDMNDEKIEDFLSSGNGCEIIDPPDPRTDLDGAIELWRGERKADP